MYVRTYASRPTGPAASICESRRGHVPRYDANHDVNRDHDCECAPDAQDRDAELAGCRKEEDQYLAQNLNPARRGWKRTDETRG